MLLCLEKVFFKGFNIGGGYWPKFSGQWFLIGWGKSDPRWDIPGEPRNQAPTKSSGSDEICEAIHTVLPWIWLVFPYSLPNEGTPSITHIMHEIISCHRKKHLGTASNWLPQEEISCHKKKSSIKSRNFLSQEEISCHRTKNFLSQEGISYHN